MEVVHVRLVLEIVESGRKEEEEVVCFSESLWGRNLVPAWVLVALTTPLLPELTQVADPGVSLEAHQGGAVDRGHH